MTKGEQDVLDYLVRARESLESLEAVGSLSATSLPYIAEAFRAMELMKKITPSDDGALGGMYDQMFAVVEAFEAIMDEQIRHKPKTFSVH